MSDVNATDVRVFGYKHWTLEENTRCFNVGKGVAGRPTSARYRNHKWHAIVKKFGFRVEICIDPVSNQDAIAWEIAIIQEMKTFSVCHSHEGDDIGCNFTLGGEGTLGNRFSHALAAKKKISKALIGRPVSIATRQKLSRNLKGKNVGKKPAVSSSNRLRRGIAKPQHSIKMMGHAPWSKGKKILNRKRPLCQICNERGHLSKTCKQ